MIINKPKVWTKPMSIENELRGNEFDNWMGGSSDGPVAESAAPQRPADRGDPTEIPAKKAKKPKASNPQRKKLLLAGSGCAAALLVGVVAWSTFSGEPEPPVAPEVAAVIAKAANLPVGADTDAATSPAAAIPASVAAPAPAPDAALASAPEAAPVAEPQVATAPAVTPPATATVSKSADEEKVEKRLKLRIEALENDLHRTQRRLSTSKSAVAGLKKKLAAAPAAGHTLSAVLSDGAVVRDNSGHEYVVKVGSEMKR